MAGYSLFYSSGQYRLFWLEKLNFPKLFLNFKPRLNFSASIWALPSPPGGGFGSGLAGLTAPPAGGRVALTRPLQSLARWRMGGAFGGVGRPPQRGLGPKAAQASALGAVGVAPLGGPDRAAKRRGPLAPQDPTRWPPPGGRGERPN